MKSRSKILVSINDLKDLYIPADGYVLGYEKYTFFASHLYSYEEIKNIKEKDKIYILLNALIHENSIEDAKGEVDCLMELGVNFIFQDIGLVKYVKNLNYQKEVIFQPYTLITNKDELKAYNDLGIDVCLSPYLNPLEYKSVNNLEHAFITIYGYIPLYQSYRKLLSLYKEKYQVFCLENRLFLKENERNELMPIIENEYGTVIFKSEPINHIELLHYLPNVKYVFIDSLFVDESVFKNIIKQVKEILNYEED